jgi:2-polyprenyl-6-methoxyphenol hydroxylase-like FAD-dependent oxidoreductase
MILLAPNATRIMSRWGNVLTRMQEIDSDQKTCEFISKEGDLLLSQELIQDYEGYPNNYMHRSRTQVIMYDFAVSLGIEILFNTRITKFFENENEAGIYVGDDKITADCVIACDGVHSRARVMITGSEDKPKPSGFAIYRSCFPIALVMNDPVAKKIIKDDQDTMRFWIGENTHGIFLTNKKLENCTCFLTHKVSNRARTALLAMAVEIDMQG